MGCTSSTTEVTEEEKVYAVSGAKRAKYRKYEVSRYEEGLGCVDVFVEEEQANEGGSDPVSMNPAEVPILVGASPDSVVRWSRKRRRSSIDTEERMWVRCEFGKGFTPFSSCSSSLVRKSAPSPLCTILEDSPLSSSQLSSYNASRSSDELTGARSTTSAVEWRRSCAGGMPHRHERRRRDHLRGGPPRYRYRAERLNRAVKVA